MMPKWECEVCRIPPGESVCLIVEAENEMEARDLLSRNGYMLKNNWRIEQVKEHRAQRELVAA